MLQLLLYGYCRIVYHVPCYTVPIRLNETSNHFIQGEGGGRGRGRPLAVGMNQHTA